MNVMRGTVRGDAVEALGARWPLVGTIGAEGQEVDYGIRPTDLVLADQGVAAQVVVVEPTGALSFAAARHAGLPIKGKRVGVIVSGGNVDLKRFAELVSSAA